MKGLVVPYVPTPIPVARKMLELAGVNSSDILADLGCGDGRIPILAAKEYGVKRAYCIELRQDLAKTADEKAAEAGVEDRVVVINADMFEFRVPQEVTVVTLFLLTSVNDALAEKLRNELRNGARVVSHEFRITSWRPLLHATYHDGRVSHNIYLYVKGWSDTP
jgi:cyclopropane fatty-acyl-phospholipid synthase-like methyltransferase